MRGRSKAPLRNRSFDLGASSELRDLEVSGSLDGTGAPVARESRDRSSNPAGHRGGRSGLRTSSAVHESHGTVHADGASRPSARSNAAGTWSPRPHRALRRRNPRPLIRGPDVLPPSSAPPGGMDRGFPLLGTLSWAGEVSPRRGNMGRAGNATIHPAARPSGCPRRCPAGTFRAPWRQNPRQGKRRAPPGPLGQRSKLPGSGRHLAAADPNPGRRRSTQPETLRQGAAAPTVGTAEPTVSRGAVETSSCLFRRRTLRGPRAAGG
jgi:hypothetical protein